MIILDIRDEVDSDKSIERIQYSCSGHISPYGHGVIKITEGYARHALVNFNEVNYLIKALQKAKELWHSKT